MLFGLNKSDGCFEVKIIRSHRRTMSLEITRDGSVTIRAPYLLPERKIKQFVSDKAGWIEKKQAMIKKRIHEKQKHQFMSGELFLFLGQQYPLLYVTRKRPALILSDHFELSETKRNKAVTVFTDWYKENALEMVSSMVNRYCAQYQLVYRKIRINSAKTRWGSCSGRGDLSFSWRLVLSPKEVLNYVVVHELAHLVHHNHSKRFWRLVEKMDPTFKKQRKWLKDNGHILVLD